MNADRGGTEFVCSLSASSGSPRLRGFIIVYQPRAKAPQASGRRDPGRETSGRLREGALVLGEGTWGGGARRGGEAEWEMNSREGDFVAEESSRSRDVALVPIQVGN